MNSWDNKFIKLAQEIATWSKDPSTKVGAILVDADHNVIGTGYNGFPRGVPDDPAEYDDREIKYSKIVHGEINAILSARGNLPYAHTLYTIPFMPCCRCAGIIIQAKISNVVTIYSDNERWKESFAITRKMFSQAQVNLTELHSVNFGNYSR